MTTMEVELTDVRRRWLQDHHPQGIVWDYDVDKPLRTQGWAAKFIVGDDLLPDLGLGAPAVTRCERVQLPPLPPNFLKNIHLEDSF